ncbi:MAG: 30S ribosomal protein S3 [Bacillota bacterium]|uniref:Small ribosomal subunit protein uS3 n=2 Tax=Carboxydocella TaxID=178898 RepID=A0A1T4SAI7_9FIRM|nr:MULTISPECIES: 30S ribosomal protein S3 [Carboxydocella]AVX21801.1 SSU ribosomal protein S3P [Carboxydocella thermautotrophica]AVX32205.1 SSU ribosomal protein S3P [Carboxydocella thermautotrophica]SKA25222.1 SSU ribosomal protein S3P [Carboxydocella sporoproducens DSM 16521]GAW27567.1 30S ribosomal protein S3 [Carboxydocella sp. ULO1]GAW30925.1 30S ribosomal protein S3 [Carboxydocella sp. JDF658]
MGQKVHPKGLRIGIIKDWDAKWFATRDFDKLLVEDVKLRRYVKNRLYGAGVSKVEIERSANRVKVTIHTAKPGIVIGRGGAEIENLRKDLEKMTGKRVNVNVQEIKVPELDAQLVAENVAAQLEKRVAFRRAMKQAVSRALRLGAGGIKIACSGRLAGAEIARTEWYNEGKVPLHTLRADIDYGFAEANTTYGKIGVKVWIYKGEVLPEAKPAVAVAEAAEGGEQ